MIKRLYKKLKSVGEKFIVSSLFSKATAKSANFYEREVGAFLLLMEDVSN